MSAVSATALEPIKTKRPAPFAKAGNSTTDVELPRWRHARWCLRVDGRLQESSWCARFPEEPALASGAGGTAAQRQRSSGARKGDKAVAGTARRSADDVAHR